MRRAVITGIGVVSPAGNSPDEFFSGLKEGKNFIREIDRFDASRYPSRHAGMADIPEAEEAFSKRLFKKLDRFSQMSLLASENALHDSRLDLGREDMERVGIIIGNALGGWGFAEEELRDLYQSGLREVSPYQATAWFPAAPQGQVSIHYGIKGFAKTIISDIASSHIAIAYAARSIAAGKAEVVLAGGAEAPISPYALLCCNTSGELSVTGRYMPFGSGRDGYVIGEGAGMLIVEEYERAVARGAKVYAEIKGFGHTSDGLDPRFPDPSGKGIARAMRLALGQAGIAPDDVDYLMPAGNGGKVGDAAEAAAVADVFGEKAGGPIIAVPKALYGNLLGASGALDAASACLSMDKGQAPAMACSPEDGWAWMKGGRDGRDLHNVMINSIGRGGVNACLVLGKPERRPSCQ